MFKIKITQKIVDNLRKNNVGKIYGEGQKGGGMRRVAGFEGWRKQRRRESGSLGASKQRIYQSWKL